MAADLLVIVPTRGRPANARRLAEAFEQTSTGHADLLFAVDGDWDNLPAYDAASGRHAITNCSWSGMVATLNREAAYWCTRYRALAFMGDDHLPRTAAWDKTFLDTLDELGTGLVYGNDLLRRETLPTAVALTSDIVQTLGYMIPPALRHLYCDNFWYDLGHALDRIRYLDDVVIEHMHPIAEKAQWDASYNRVNSPPATEADRAAYNMYRLVQFDRDVAALKALL